jgi:hypothetical protein
MGPVRKGILTFSLIGLVSFAAHAYYTFGYEGRDGYDGQSGYDGRTPENVVLKATGQTVSLDLNGSDGRDGRDGENGEDATSCYQNKPAANLRGADGGDGGNGGRGGDGGNGADITIYADNLTNLQKVFVSSRPGDGGRSGRPGYGARPCYCRTHSWQTTTCHQEKQPNGTYKEVCYTNTYYCEDGQRGTDGNYVSDGGRGHAGSLTLIKRLADLEPVTPSLNVSLSQILSGTFTLSDNIWLTKTGARQLLAAGSFVADQFQEFSHKQLYPVAFAWEAKRPLSDFAGQSLTLKVNSSKTAVDVLMPSSIWYQARHESIQGTQKMVVEKILFAKEAEALTIKVQGAKRELIAVVQDEAGVSDLLQTGFRLKLENEKFFGDKTLYNGVVPKEFVTVEGGGKFTIRMGQLPGVPLKNIEPDDKIEIDLNVVRQLNQQSLTKRFNFKHKIP